MSFSSGKAEKKATARQGRKSTYTHTNLHSVKTLIGFLAGLGLMHAVSAQTLTVTDQKTGEPIEGVVIGSTSPRAFSLTNAKGMAPLQGFENAAVMTVQHLGYLTVVTTYAKLEAAGFALALERSAFNLDEVVVSATRWRQSSATSTSRVASITAKEVALMNPQTAADLLGISGKVFIQKSQQGGGSPMIRGFATNRLLYTVDGVRMNTAIFRAGNIQNVINLDPFAVENTEVLFGPGSVIYGSDAIGGVMSFQTLESQLSATDDPLVTGKAVTRFSSANREQTGHFDVNVGWKKFAMVTSFSSWDYDHLRQGRNGPDDYIKDVFVQRQDSTDVVVSQSDPLLQIPSAYSQINMMQKFRFRPNTRWDIEYGFHYSETSPYGRYDRHNRFRNGLPRHAEWDYGVQSWMMNLLSVSHIGNNAVYDEVSVRTAHQRFEESRIDRNLNSDERNTQTEQVEALSVNVDFVKQLGKHKLMYGGEWLQNDVASSGMLTNLVTGVDAQGPSRYPQSLWGSVAGYLSDEFAVSERFTVNAGVRYNRFSIDADFANNLDFYPFPFERAEVNNASVTGNAGVAYRPSATWLIRAGVGTAFRSPNVDDLGKVFDSEPGAVTVPNPDLEAEYAYNADLGVAKVFGDFLKVELTGYYTVLENALVRRNFQLNGADSIVFSGELSQVQAIQNAAVANVYGLQGSVEVKLPAGFSFSSDINWQVGEEELDDGSTSASRHAAPWFGLSRLTYQSDRVQLQFYAMYQGERRFEDLAVEEQGKDEIYTKDANGNNFAPAWYTLNVKALVGLNKTFTLSGGLENLTDQRYRPYSSGISGAGRNLVLALTARF